ncbi:MAG: hypothetical protein IPL92_04385 [Saprospiraceae bacterium]|nr:hypothetical protein [Candidatus Opimibacter iunctus]
MSTGRGFGGAPQQKHKRYRQVCQTTGFVTDNVEQTVNLAMDAGGTLLENPETKPRGQVEAYVRDLDRILIEICTPTN